MRDVGDSVDRRASKPRAVADENSFVVLDQNADDVASVLGGRKFARGVSKVPGPTDTNDEWFRYGRAVNFLERHIAAGERADSRIGGRVRNVEDVQRQPSVGLAARPGRVDHWCRCEFSDDHGINAFTAFQFQPVHKFSRGLHRFEAALGAHCGNAIR